LAIKYLAGERLIGTAAERAALTTLGSAGWLSNVGLQGSFTSSQYNDVSVDTTAENIKAKNWAVGSLQFSGMGISYDLGSALSNTLWTLRFSVTTSIDDSNPSGNAYWNIGLVDGKWLGGKYDDTGAYTSTVNDENEDAIFLTWHIADDNVGWTVFDNDVRQEDYDAIANDHDLDTSVVRYYQITRNSPTILGLEYHGTAGFVSDPVNTTATPSSLSNISGLRWLATGFPYNNGQASSSAGWELRIDNIQVWNGVSYHGATPSTTATHSFDFSNTYPNLTNGTIFEESDTGKHYMFDGTSAWNETV